MIRGEESILTQLDASWPQVNLQTKWELKPLLSYGTTYVSSESGDPPSAADSTPKPVGDTVIPGEGSNPEDELIAPTPSSSFCQPQSPTPVT